MNDAQSSSVTVDVIELRLKQMEKDLKIVERAAMSYLQIYKILNETRQQLGL